MMVSTSATHMKKNSGLHHAEYWAEAERAIRKAHDAGIKVNGTVSTIWGCPMEGPTKLEDAVTFTKRFLDIGADDIEAEASRLEKLGAKRVAKIHGWIVMQAPTGQRFCVVQAKSKEFLDQCRVWE